MDWGPSRRRLWLAKSVMLQRYSINGRANISTIGRITSCFVLRTAEPVYLWWSGERSVSVSMLFIRRYCGCTVSKQNMMLLRPYVWLDAYDWMLDIHSPPELWGMEDKECPDYGSFGAGCNGDEGDYWRMSLVPDISRLSNFLVFRGMVVWHTLVTVWVQNFLDHTIQPGHGPSIKWGNLASGSTKPFFELCFQFLFLIFPWPLTGASYTSYGGTAVMCVARWANMRLHWGTVREMQAYSDPYPARCTLSITIWSPRGLFEAAGRWQLHRWAPSMELLMPTIAGIASRWCCNLIPWNNKVFTAPQSCKLKQHPGVISHVGHSFKYIKQVIHRACWNTTKSANELDSPGDFHGPPWNQATEVLKSTATSSKLC